MPGSLSGVWPHEDLLRRELLSPSRRGYSSYPGRTRSEDVVVASVEEEFGRGSVDEVWIPSVASQHGVV